MIIGIDEAGRGSAVGDMVVCGVAIPDESFQDKLLEIGVRDSKKITGKKKLEKRYELSSNIRKITGGKVIIESVTAAQIDKYRLTSGTLDNLEVIMASTIIRRFTYLCKIDRVICDGNLFTPLIDKFPAIVIQCHSKADELWPVVSAASVCAKNSRDQIITMIMGGSPGGGYPNQKTWEWIKGDYAENGRYSDHIRKTWSWFAKKYDEHHDEISRK